MEEQVFSHVSVLLQECMDALCIKPDGIYIDGTAGGGGHSSEIASHLETGKLIALDRDMSAVKAAGARLEKYGERAQVVHSNFSEMAQVCRQLGIEGVDGVLLDLGVSSYQLDTADRGFSYMADAPLDMRMNREDTLDAYTVVNTYTEQQLKKIIYDYGEERFAPRIAQRIVQEREKQPIRTTGELVNVIKAAMPAAAKEGGHHPAKRTFQAIRIEVNGELSVIEPTIRDAVSLLKPGGRIAIITFHSLEDRLVKQTFASLASGCTCPRDFPVCVCGKKPLVDIISRKPVLPSEQELAINPRSRSAKLRVAQKRYDNQ
ncbi:MAG: 16S rRNA (cytosine(1402)-N(4))-methyltransferase RsmH [Clostridia bacterium]|nr:16S rRNA (cytosine(1402)-N(4))-methyltransferase RsmH [Clostridia bacterium]